jgi:hypothetical protein
LLEASVALKSHVAFSHSIFFHCDFYLSLLF